jgi:hypothetical protein
MNEMAKSLSKFTHIFRHPVDNKKFTLKKGVSHSIATVEAVIRL